MKRGLWIFLLAVLAFAAILVANMPVSWVIPARIAQHECAALDGSLWSGTCSGVMLNGRPLGDVAWELHPLQLLLLRLAAHVTLGNGPASAEGELVLTPNKHLTIRSLRAELPLDPRLIPEVPQNMLGRATLDVSLAELSQGVLTRLEGRIEAHDIEDRTGGHDTPLGSYLITFPPGASGDPIGHIRDTDGPLAVDGTLKLTRAPGFEIAGFIAPRQNASPEVVNNIAFLGSPDASGRRDFSLAGTF